MSSLHNYSRNGLVFRKSSFSNDQQACVEVATAPDGHDGFGTVRIPCVRRITSTRRRGTTSFSQCAMESSSRSKYFRAGAIRLDGQQVTDLEQPGLRGQRFSRASAEQPDGRVPLSWRDPQPVLRESFPAMPGI
jgi:hypothetical protein